MSEQCVRMARQVIQNDKCRAGQSLVELLVAITLGVIFMIGAVTLIAPALRTNQNATQIQVGASLARELLDSVRVYAESNWQTFTNLQLGPANRYYVNATGSPFTIATGTQNVQVATTTYTISFYILTVGRNASGTIPGAANDPSTRQVVVDYTWFGDPPAALSTYVTRSQSRIFAQTDWTSGPGVEGPVTFVGTGFSTSSGGITHTSTPGSIMISL